MTDDRTLLELVAAERAKYEWVWRDPRYYQQSPAFRQRDAIARALQLPMRGGPIADIGCGAGTTASHFLAMGISVVGVDITDAPLRGYYGGRPKRPGAPPYEVGDPPMGAWTFVQCALHELAGRFQVESGYCVDVMEHIPPVLVDASLYAISRCIRGRVYFNIARFPDDFGRELGVGPLHLSLFDHAEWMRRLWRCWREVQTLYEGPDLHHGGLISTFLVDDPRSEV